MPSSNSSPLATLELPRVIPRGAFFKRLVLDPCPRDTHLGLKDGQWHFFEDDSSNCALNPMRH